MTTPTPRTDAIKLTESGAAGMLKDYYDLCGQLERELLSCNVIKDNIRVCAESLERDLAAAQEANEQLRKERDAAFAMSRCECQSEECCRNLVEAQEARQRAEGALSIVQKDCRNLTEKVIPAIEERAQRAEARAESNARALAAIREEWAGAECGEPVTAQEAYAINLCKRMYQLAVEALK